MYMSKEEITIQQTPIEKAIADINSQIKHHKNYSNRDWIVSSLQQSVATLQSLLPYEKQYLRDVAEKVARHIIENYVQKEWNNNDEYLLQTYLNQNHPL